MSPSYVNIVNIVYDDHSCVVCEGHVMAQLEFITTPANVTVENGTETTLPCIATGASTIFYLWNNGNTSNPLSFGNDSSDRIHYIGNVNGTLMFNEVTTDDEDIYVCVALDSNDPNNSIISDPAYLTGMLMSVCPSVYTV